MKFTVDRIEENIVVVELEDKTIINIDKSFFPEDIKEGKSYKMELTEIETDIKNRFSKLFN